MVTRKAASQQAATQQAAVKWELSQSVQDVRVSLGHGQRMRNNNNNNNSNNDSDGDGDSAWAVVWGATLSTEHGGMRARCIAQPDWSAHPR